MKSLVSPVYQSNPSIQAFHMLHAFNKEFSDWELYMGSIECCIQVKTKHRWLCASTQIVYWMQLHKIWNKLGLIEHSDIFSVGKQRVILKQCSLLCYHQNTLKCGAGGDVASRGQQWNLGWEGPRTIKQLSTTRMEAREWNNFVLLDNNMKWGNVCWGGVDE